MRPVGIAAQLSLTNVDPLRLLRRWIARATSSLPSRFAVDENAGVRAGDRLDEREHVLQGFAFTHDFPKFALISLSR